MATGKENAKVSMSAEARARRARIVRETNANGRMEGFEPTAEMRALDRQFIEGKISASDIVEHFKKKYSRRAGR